MAAAPPVPPVSAFAPTAAATTPRAPRLAASLLLLRDGVDGLEVLMLRRADRAGDAWSGAAVFPGGVLDAHDRHAQDVCCGVDDARASAQLGLACGGLDFMVAAIRETFEEVGLLLAQGDVDLAALAPWRRRMQAGEIGIATMCRELGLTLDLSGLAYFAHWLTPPGSPKRFDTRFFAALAPPGQLAEADRGEAVELMWLSPRQALAPERALKLVAVTRQLLEELAGHASAAEVMAAARARGRVERVMPRRSVDANGARVLLPQHPAYAEIGRIDPEGRADSHCDIVAGRAVALSPHVLRVTAPNPGAMTGPGTNSYLVGGGNNGADGWTVIDPGPTSEPHLRALLAAVAERGGRIERIVVTHTHRDHSPGAVALAQATGAPVWGRHADHPEWQDEQFAPQRELQHGDRIDLGTAGTLRVIHTPGHASNHLCFLLEGEKLLFTGDHVMQGSTVVINPPDGDMSVYLQSLRELQREDLEWLAPGHGFLVADPQAVLGALIAHRLRREAKLIAALQPAPGSGLDDLLTRVYDDVPAKLHAMARRSLLAHLLKLQRDGVAAHAHERWSAA